MRLSLPRVRTPRLTEISDTEDRLHRNTIFFALPLALFGISALLLIWSVLRLNIPTTFRTEWPWRLQLLDVQSATTVAAITGGLIFARAQYATSVRPMIGWTGRVVEAKELPGELIWLVRIFNSATAPVVVNSLSYHVILKASPSRVVLGGYEPPWLSRTEAIETINMAGLRLEDDYDLRYIGSGYPLSASNQDSGWIARFNQESFQAIKDVIIRVVVVDQAGDTYQRMIYCMRGVDNGFKRSTIE